MMLKDFSDELIALYEDAEEAAAPEEGVENNVVTALAATDLSTAYELLQKANPDLAKLINKGSRYSVYFADLEDVHTKSSDTPGLFEFWTVIKLMVDSKSGWSGKGMTNHWTQRLVNAFYKPALTEAGIFKALHTKFNQYEFKFNNSVGIDNEHACFFSGPGGNIPDFSSKLGTVECKPEGVTSNTHGADYVLRYTRPYNDSNSGKFWFELGPNVESTLADNPLDTLPQEAHPEDFSIAPVILNGTALTKLYNKLRKKAVLQPELLAQDYSTLRANVIKQLDDVNKLEKDYFVDANHSLKDAPLNLQAATKQLHTLINKKAEVAKLLPESIEGQTDFMKTYEELNTLN